MRVVVALGGNALLRRGEALTMAHQQESIVAACRGLHPLLDGHDLVLTHGNGPQVGLLALQASSYASRHRTNAAQGGSDATFDVLGAETEGMIGYLLERELRNQLGSSRAVATLVTMVEVDPDDPAFDAPTKFVGPGYSSEEAQLLAHRYGWNVRPDGEQWRRVVPSPTPLRIVELEPVRWLLDHRTVVICAGGGGIPTSRSRTGQLVGIEAVIDKDRASAVLARAIGADQLIIVTDVEGVVEGWGTDEERLICYAGPDALDPREFPAGSMGPKVQAAIDFPEDGGEAVIGSLAALEELATGRGGTRVSRRFRGRMTRPRQAAAKPADATNRTRRAS